MLFHRFPVEYQMDSQDCGPASLKIIAKYFGKFYSVSILNPPYFCFTIKH